MKNPLLRRKFLQFLAFASANMVAGCGDESTNPLGTGGASGSGSNSGTGGAGGAGGGRPGSKKTVLVIGGGLAGMCSAYELHGKEINGVNYEVLAVLEAQNRTGGRVLTYRDLADNQYAELGATRIADTHKHTIHYAKDVFNLKLREFSSGDPIYYLKGKKFIKKSSEAWPKDVFPNLETERATLDADALVYSYYKKLEELGDPLAVDWPKGDIVTKYDKLGILDYLKANGAPDDVLLLDKAINGTELDYDGALYWLMADVVDALWDKTYAIEGGNDKLPSAFAKALGDLIKYESVATAITHDKDGVEVTFTQKGQSQKLRADYCVCAIPFSTLRKIQITPGLSEDKQSVVNNLAMMPVSRFNMQTKSRFWNMQGLGGLKLARTDTYVERLWDLSAVQDGKSGLLASYMMADNALKFAMQPQEQRAAYITKEVSKFFPEIGAEVTKTVEKIWKDDPWVGGGWAYYGPGQMGAMFPAAKKPEGRIYFCGEHTSPWSGWMQGALESASRVVKEISGKS